MKVEQTDILSLLGRKAASFTVPVYQRQYTWGRDQLDALWRDAMKASRTGKGHFIGTVFFAPSKEGDKTELSLIDGQQRMVTLYLLVDVLAKRLEEEPGLVGSTGPASIKSEYLLVDGTCKLMSTRPDRRSMEYVILGAELPPEEERSEAIINNHCWFASRMRTPEFDAEALWRGLQLLQVIAVEAEEGDRAQSIFETLNAKGMPLSECMDRFARIHHERDRAVKQIGMNNRVFGD